MRTLAYILVLLQAVAISLAMPPYNGYEQAGYTVVNTFDGYEEREYPSQKWACTARTYDLEEADTASRAMFMTLFGYISGKGNTQGIKIPMTVPVVTEHTPLLDGNIVTGRTSKMCFFIGQAHQASPPEPEAPVTVETRSMTVFVETYSGYMKDCDWAKKVGSFAKKLRGQVDTTSYLTVGYDSPWRFWNRKNEAMLKKMPAGI